MDFSPYISRYRNGEWRTSIFRDMILADASRLRRDRRELTFLDIGCGSGFDNDATAQAELADRCSNYIGVEPDMDVPVRDIVATVHRCRLEVAPIEPQSVDIAFATMVVEHLEDPAAFWNKVGAVLRPGGVFWAFTVDARHPFIYFSRAMERLGVKDRYLDLLHGRRGERRYENYKVFYRSNAPSTVGRLASRFSEVQFCNLQRSGQLDYYIPRGLRWTARMYDHVAAVTGLPGVQFVVRARR